MTYIGKYFRGIIATQVLREVGNVKTINSQSIRVLERDYNDDVAECSGTVSFPTDGGSGYAVGCEYIDTDALIGAQLYVNEGTNTSCDFNLVKSITSLFAVDNTVDTDKKIQFRDAGLYIQSSSDGVLDIVSDTVLAISAPTTTFDGLVDLGTYGSKIVAPAGTNTELLTVALEGAEDDFYIGIGSYVRVTGENGKPFGVAATIETTNTTGIDRMQGGQFISLLGSAGGSEAARLTTLGGDATAGMYGVWAKVGANSNCVTDSGSRVAAIWVDNQMSGTVDGEEYGIFATTGASKPDAFIGFETTSSGWANLFSFDETSYDQDPIATATITGGTQDRYFKVNLNGTAYGLALYTGW